MNARVENLTIIVLYEREKDKVLTEKGVLSPIQYRPLNQIFYPNLLEKHEFTPVDF